MDPVRVQMSFLTLPPILAPVHKTCGDRTLVSNHPPQPNIAPQTTAGFLQSKDTIWTLHEVVWLVFLYLSTADIWPHHSAVGCPVHCGMPAASCLDPLDKGSLLPSCGNLKCLQMRPDVPGEQGSRTITVGAVGPNNSFLELLKDSHSKGLVRTDST